MEVAMRIKIKGEITAERLAEALHAAAEKYEAVRPGHKVYGANLYLVAHEVNPPLPTTYNAQSSEHGPPDFPPPCRRQHDPYPP